MYFVYTQNIKVKFYERKFNIISRRVIKTLIIYFTKHLKTKYNEQINPYERNVNVNVNFLSPAGSEKTV